MGWVIAGVIVLVVVLGGLFTYIALQEGPGIVLFALTVTAVLCGAALMIEYGVEGHL